MKIVTKETIQVAVLGVGFGITHVKALAEQPGTLRLKMVCDQNEERLESAKQVLGEKAAGILFTKDYHDILNDPDIDVVDLALPHHLHQRFAEEFAAAGKHIMLDKPLARTEEEGKAIIEAARKNDVQLMVAFNFRFAPMYQAIQKRISDGVIGQVLLGLTRHNQRFFYPGGSNWRNSASIGGGAIIGSGVHNIDFMRFCLGDPAEVYACGVNDAKRLDAEAGAAVVFRYANGTVVNFFCNWCKSSRNIDASGVFGEWEFFGETGELRKVIDKGLCISRLDDSVEEVEYDKDATILTTFTNLWRHFEECLRTGKTPLTSGEEALKTQHLIAIVYESMKTGKPIRF